MGPDDFTGVDNGEPSGQAKTTPNPEGTAQGDNDPKTAPCPFKSIRRKAREYGLFGSRRHFPTFIILLCLWLMVEKGILPSVLVGLFEPGGPSIPTLYRWKHEWEAYLENPGASRHADVFGLVDISSLSSVGQENGSIRNDSSEGTGEDSVGNHSDDPDGNDTDNDNSTDNDNDNDSNGGGNTAQPSLWSRFNAHIKAGKALHGIPTLRIRITYRLLDDGKPTISHVIERG